MLPKLIDSETWSTPFVKLGIGDAPAEEAVRLEVIVSLYVIVDRKFSTMTSWWSNRSC